MKQYTQKEFIQIVRKNGYTYNRHSGSHAIYIKDGKHISIPKDLARVVAYRLIRENNLTTGIRRRGR